MSPALREKLTTNYVPTPQEFLSIKHGLADSEEQLHKLSVQVDGLQERYDNLLLEQQRLSAGTLSYRCMLAPARRLIPDILQEIFHHCLPTSHNAVLSSRETPLLLTQVCKHWRQVAHSTPRLWASVHITLPVSKAYRPFRPADNSATLSAVSSWLSHSGVLPLSISLSSSMFSSSPSLPTNIHVRPFLDLLVPFASRWKSISFIFEHYDWTEFFNRLNAEDLPLLEKIHFGGSQIPYPMIGDSQSLDFAAATRDHSILRAPKLRSVSIPRYAQQILQLPINWSELIELNLSDGVFSLRDILKALTLCPNLAGCSISLSDWNSMAFNDESYAPPKVVMPKLEVLVLKDDIAQHDMPALLECLIAPQLCHLSFRRGMDWAGDPYSELRHLIRALKAFCRSLVQPLQELELEVNSLSLESVMQILELLPGLRRLSLESYGKAETVVDANYTWITPNSFYFTDEPLRRFIPKLITVRHQGSERADLSLGGWDSHSDSESTTSTLDVPLVGLFNTPTTPAESESRTVVNRLCPNLEVFHCSGAMFSESSFLEFLRARSLKHHELGVAHLCRVSVSFVAGRKESSSFTEQVTKLAKQTGTSVYLNYSQPLVYLPPPPHLYSPYQGVEDGDDTNYPPVRFGFRRFRWV